MMTDLFIVVGLGVVAGFVSCQLIYSGVKHLYESKP